MVVLANGGRLGEATSFCFYCGRPVKKYPQRNGFSLPLDARTLDHALPQCRGGGYRDTVTACLKCNRDKSHLTLDEYRAVQALRAGTIKLPEYRFAAEQGI